MRLPHEDIEFSRVKALVGDEPPHWERVLEPGDILFVPRGEVHRTEVDGPHSLHLTIAIRPPRGDAVMRWLVDSALKAEEVLRRDVTPLAGREALREQAVGLRAAMNRILDGLDLEAFLDDENRTRSPIDALTMGMVPLPAAGVHVVPALRRPMPPMDGDDGAIRIGRCRYRLTADEGRVLAVLMERGSLSPAAIGEAVPDI